VPDTSRFGRIRFRKSVLPRVPRWTGLLAACALVAACTSVGPGTVARDRFDYGRAISDSWKLQTLLNIVKVRYVDPPIHMEVGQIVSGAPSRLGSAWAAPC